ncbi:MAG: hypothetical protein QOI10_2538 [Solirubrobacterales bacterium]|jgi:hypothetical protein|nr:hypothetical protein [Solirubrobacterales bacterium]
MPTVTRRGLLALGGSGLAGVALAGCAAEADPRKDASQSDLVDAEAEGEAALATAYAQAASSFDTGEERATLERFAAAAGKRANQVRRGSDTNTTPPGQAPDGGPDSPEALAGAVHAANVAISAHREAAGLLDTVEGRALASSSLAACAAELAAVDLLAGDPASPNAFVTGGPEKPYESTDSPDTSSTTTSTTSSSSTTSTSSTGQ